MGRSQLQYNRRARGRRGGAGGGRVGEGGRSDRASSRVKGLPSNEFRFQHKGGGDEGKTSSRRGEESDDLRAYTLGGDLNASRPQPAESKGGEDEEELSSLILDLSSLAQGLLTLPVHERLGVDRAYTEGVEYRDGIGRDVGDEEGPAAHSRKETEEEEEEEKKEQIMRPAPPPAVAQVRQVKMDESASLVDSSLEALLGLEISDKGEGQGGEGITASTGSRQPTAASPASSSAAANDLLDDLLALDAGIGATGGGGGGGATSNPKQIRTASSSSTKKTSMLDDGGY